MRVYYRQSETQGIRRDKKYFSWIIGKNKAQKKMDGRKKGRKNQGKEKGMKERK